MAPSDLTAFISLQELQRDEQVKNSQKGGEHLASQGASYLPVKVQPILFIPYNETKRKKNKISVLTTALGELSRTWNTHNQKNWPWEGKERRRKVQKWKDEGSVQHLGGASLW